ncbi:unnamed protein product, partial [Ectocarpus sp. 12 AP-2014]
LERWRSSDAALRFWIDTLDSPALSLDGTWTSRLWCPLKASRIRLELNQAAVLMTARATMHATSTRELSHKRRLKLHRCWFHRLVMPIRHMK